MGEDSESLQGFEEEEEGWKVKENKRSRKEQLVGRD